MSPGMPAVGRLIRECRHEAGLTQETLAKAIGCSKAHLSLMESGQRSVSPQRARRIEAALGLEDGRIVAAVHWRSIPADMRARVEESWRGGSR
jgi:transcriptional regulator with XRE-family HTH domain